MGTRPTKPKTIHEAQERIRKVIHHMRFNPQLAGPLSFDQLVAFRVPKNTNWPIESVRFVQKQYDQGRRMLSRRVHRCYRRSPQISLVCSLIRRSPIFLRDKWVNEVILEKKKRALWHPNSREREQALQELKEISEAIVSEKIPTRERKRGKKWKRLSAKRQSDKLLAAVELLGRYTHYLEIATCLLAGKDLTRKQRVPSGKSPTDPETLPVYAEMFGVPEDWIATAWAKKRVTAREWTLSRLAVEYDSTPAGIRRRYEDAESLRRREVQHSKAVFGLRQRSTDRRKPRRSKAPKPRRRAPRSR